MTACRCCVVQWGRFCQVPGRKGGGCSAILKGARGTAKGYCRPEGKWWVATGEGGGWPKGRVSPAGLSCLSEPASAGIARGGSAAASGRAAVGYPQSKPCLLPAAAAASPKSSSILPGPRFTRPAGSVTRVRPGGMGHAHRVLLGGKSQPLRWKIGGPRGLAQQRAPPNAGFSVRARARPQGSVGAEPFRLALFVGRVRILIPFSQPCLSLCLLLPAWLYGFLLILASKSFDPVLWRLTFQCLSKAWSCVVWGLWFDSTLKNSGELKSIAQRGSPGSFPSGFKICFSFIRSETQKSHCPRLWPPTYCSTHFRRIDTVMVTKAKRLSLQFSSFLIFQLHSGCWHALFEAFSSLGCLGCRTGVLLLLWVCLCPMQSSFPVHHK